MFRISKVVIAAVIITAGLSSCSPEKERTAENLAHPYEDYLYQYSIIDTLLAGVYDGDLTVGELKEKGTLGLGGSMAWMGSCI